MLPLETKQFGGKLLPHSDFRGGSVSRGGKYAEEILGIINVGSDAIGQLLIIYSVFVKYLRKNGNTMRQCISSL